MSGLLPFLSFLLVAAAGGGAEAKLAGVAEANSETVAAYWQTALPSSPIPLAVLDLFTPTDDKNGSIHKSAMEDPHISGPRKLGKHSPTMRKTKKTREDEFIKLPYNYGPHKKEANQNTQKFRSSYGPSRDGDVQNIKAFPYWYGPNRDGDVQKIKAFPYRYSPHGDGVDQKIKVFPYWYGSHRDRDEDDQNIKTYPYNYGPHEEGSNQMTHTFPCIYGPVGEADDQKTPKFPYIYGPVGEVDDQKTLKFPYIYGPVDEVDDQEILKFPYNYGPVGEADDQKVPKFPYSYSPRTKFGERQAHVHGHGHGNDDATDIFFSEDILTQGSLVTPHIQPTTSSPVLLRRDVADSIPVSTKSFAEVVAMFAPASLAMADDIRLTADVCEHPRPIEGEKITCATSLESLAEFPVSELGTQDVRAFSSDVPREGTASRRYNITALRVVTDSSTKTATCHDMAYPYAVFYCHTVHADSPTRTYMVTLASEDGGDGAPAPTMEALAVCHLNTSKWDPNHPFFVKRHVKPGDTTVCHFLTRGSFLWAPTANTSGGAEQVAAQ